MVCDAVGSNGRQLLSDPAKLWLVIERRHSGTTKASCKLCRKRQEKLLRTRNFNDTFTHGVEDKALKKDNLEKHELSVQHRDTIRLEKGPQSMSELYRTTAPTVVSLKRWSVSVTANLTV